MPEGIVQKAIPLDGYRLRAQAFCMANELTRENKAFIERMVKQGRFENQGEVVRAALRRMEREENSYLNPPPLTDEERRRCFGPMQKKTPGNTLW
jgi:hypothetical protein